MKIPALILAFCCMSQMAAGAAYDDHHLLLDQKLSAQEAAASPYLFNEVREALAALGQYGKSAPADTITLSIAPGVYWVDDPDSPEVRRTSSGDGTPYGFRVECPIVRLEGLSSDAADVVLASNRGQTQGALGNFTMLYFNSESIEARNITFGNYCSVDLDYAKDISLSRRRRCDAIVQAQLIHTGADRVWADNCRFISRLNLCPFSGAQRALFTGCHFECTDDALQGSAIYSNCHFEFFSSKPFYVMPDYGAVMLDCQIDTHVSDVQYFSKTGGSIALIRTAIRQVSGADVKVRPCYGYTSAASYYSDVTLNGKPLVVEDAIDISGKPLLRAYNIPNLLAGNDQWDPLNMRGQTSADDLGLPVWMRIVNTEGENELDPQDDVRHLRAVVNYWGGDNEASDDAVSRMSSGSVSWTAPRTLKVTEPKGLASTLVSANQLPVESKATVSATLPSGLSARTTFTILPKLDEAPAFTQAPTLQYDKKEKGIALSYQLTPGRDDRSRIVWYRYTRDDLSDTIAVRQGTTAGERIYAISRADRDHRIAARVIPAYANTRYGEPIVITYPELVTVRSVPSVIFEEQSLMTDFHNLPVHYQPSVGQGIWTFDTYKPADTKAYSWQPSADQSWLYAMGVDGCAGQKGLIQASRGARCIYIPARDKAGNMEAIVKIDPAKTAGQGFGSATGQYMDVCIKYDPASRCGYALRIERVPDYDRAVVFCLVEYRGDEVVPLSEKMPAICYRSTCTVTVSLKGTTLTATAVSSAQLPAPSSPEVQTEVFLKATVAKTDAAGFCIQHTGTVGSGVSMIRHVALKW